VLTACGIKHPRCLLLFACWIPKATNTHSGCVILITFSLQQWLHEHVSRLLDTYTACLVMYAVCKIQLQAWSVPEDSRKLKFPDYMTTAQDGGKVVSPTHRPPLPPRNAPGNNFCYRLSRPQAILL